MQMVMPCRAKACPLPGWGIAALLVAEPALDGGAASGLASLGATVEVEPLLYNAMAQVIDDARTADLFAVDCDTVGGIEAGMRAFGILAESGVRLPVLLISTQCRRQSIPVFREAPFMLRAPVSKLALRLCLQAAFPGNRRCAVLSG